jgi:DNA-binding response OmpR family regulator
MLSRGNAADTTTFQYADVTELARDASQRWTHFEETELPPPFYRVALGQVPLQLGDLEFRLLMLLASKPYRPFSRHFIAAAVTTRRRPVAEDEVDQHIATLREQLGFFRDYVQTVPYLGYRFKP